MLPHDTLPKRTFILRMLTPLPRPRKYVLGALGEIRRVRACWMTLPEGIRDYEAGHRREGGGCEGRAAARPPPRPRGRP